MAPIVPVILSGGAGTRLWPLSRPEMPKQLLALTGTETMLQLTAARVADRSRFAAPLVVANARNDGDIVSQLADADGGDATLILEPCGRNTAAAIALAALARVPDDLLLVMPSDHVIGDVGAFQAAIDAGRGLAAAGWLLTFGVTADRAETGFGYIERGEPLSAEVDAAARFVEKPDRAAAEGYLSNGRFVWNSGIFMFRAGAYLDALGIHAPKILDAAGAAMAGAVRDGRRLLPAKAAFAASPSLSIDVAVMEKASRVAVVPVSMGWSDVGSWDALYEILDKDADGNALRGEVLAIDSHNLLVRAEGVQVSLIDVEDMTVIVTKASVLIVKRGSSQRVREAVAASQAERQE